MKTKIAFAILLGGYCAWYALHPLDWHFIDNVDLLFHEAGHWIFMPFGFFMSMLGGSLTQLLIPLICTISFLRKQDSYAAGLMLYWLGINFINVSVYAGDALRMQLPLLGGDNSIHDWNWLLIRLGWLRHTPRVAAIIFTLGVLSMLAAFALSMRAATGQPRQKPL